MRSLLLAFADGTELLEEDELLRLADELLAEHGDSEAWERKRSESWVSFRCKQQPRPAQGWKLHVSATPHSAAGVLGSVVPVLAREGCSFKMIATKRLLYHLNEAHSTRAGSGKFLTLYPSAAHHALALAEACDRATRGQEGPAILSDRRYRPESLVHYRFGSFIPQTVYSSEGRIVHVVRDPDGRPVPDRREAWFSAPEWAEDPFRKAEDGGAGRSAGSGSPSPVLLDGRYEVSRALRHANKGGIYLAMDQDARIEVVVKEARPHVGVDRFGRDAIDRLRVEAANLERLSALGVAPRPLDLFEQGGHLFLVMERVEGESLRRWRGRQPDRLDGETLAELAHALASLLDRCHGAGILVRDFNPNNVMVLADGELQLIDPEMACPEGETLPMGVGGFTPGYASPEQIVKEVPRRSDDYYSLAATLFFLATQRDPYLLPEKPSRRSHRARLEEQLTAMVREGLIPPEIADSILGGLASVPEERWGPKEVRTRVSEPREESGHEPEGRAPHLVGPMRRPEARPTEGWWLRVTRDLASSALESIDLDDPMRPVQSSCPGTQTDPCNVQHGAAGVGSFLLSALPLLDDAGRRTLRALGQWVAADLQEPQDRPQGLYFGIAGACWFLLDLAEELRDAELRKTACDVARSLEPLPRLFDITHGASGIGLTLLRFHLVTGDPEFHDRATELARRVVEGAASHPEGPVWPQPAPSGDAAAFYGFAHGNAGIAYFLLSVHAVTGAGRFLDSARSAMETLVNAVHLDDGRAYWPHGPDRPTLWTYWCNGSSGVATALVRMYAATGDRRYRRLAEQAASAVYEHRWLSHLGQCHGLAGNGEFLLDLYQLLGEPRYRQLAIDLAGVLRSYRVYRDGRIAFPDDSRLMISPDFGVGAAGIGSFLHRLATGRPRLFLLDDLLRPSALSSPRIMPSKGESTGLPGPPAALER